MKLRSTLMWVVLTLLVLPGLAIADNILVIESYHSDHPWDISYKRGIENILGASHEIRYFQMDTKRVPRSAFPKRADLAWEEYLATSPDLVILGDDNALKYLGPRLAETGTPVVYLGINANPRRYGLLGKKNITGVLERPLLKRSIRYLNEILKPSPRKILVLFDTSTTSQTLLEEQFRGKKVLAIGYVEIELRLVERYEEWKSAVRMARGKGYDALIVGLYHTIVDERGKHVESEAILRWADENTPVPMFGFWDFSVGRGKTIGGLVHYGQEQGETAGKIAEKILQGETPGQIFPVTAEHGKLLFSRSQLKRWGIELPGRIVSEAKFVE